MAPNSPLSCCCCWPNYPPLSPKATGVSDVNEVIQKMVSQESTAESLMILTKENQVMTRIYQLRFASCSPFICLVILLTNGQPDSISHTEFGSRYSTRPCAFESATSVQQPTALPVEIQIGIHPMLDHDGADKVRNTKNTTTDTRGGCNGRQPLDFYVWSPQARIEGLNKRKSSLKAAVEEVKYSGPGEGHRRKVKMCKKKPKL